MHRYLYIQNNYIPHTQIYYVNTDFWMRLIAINFCTALVYFDLIVYCSIHYSQYAIFKLKTQTKTHLELTNLAFSVEVDKGSHSG